MTKRIFSILLIAIMFQFNAVAFDDSYRIEAEQTYYKALDKNTALLKEGEFITSTSSNGSMRFYLKIAHAGTYSVKVGVKKITSATTFIEGRANTTTGNAPLRQWLQTDVVEYAAGSFSCLSSTTIFLDFAWTQANDLAAGVAFDYFMLMRNEISNATSYSFFGDGELTDYKAQTEVRFGQDSTTDDKFSLIVRARDHGVYGKNYYAASLANGRQLLLEKSFRNTVTTITTIEIPEFMDGVVRKLTLYAFNEEISVFLDDVLLIEYIDTETTAILYGGVGTYISGLYISNEPVEVTHIQDTAYGKYDNFFGKTIRYEQSLEEIDVTPPAWSLTDTLHITDGICDTIPSSYFHSANDISVYFSMNSNATSRPSKDANVVLLSQDAGYGNLGWSVELTYYLQLVFRVGSIKGAARTVSTSADITSGQSLTGFSGGRWDTFVCTFNSETNTLSIYRSDIGLTAQQKFYDSFSVSPNVSGGTVPLMFGKTNIISAGKATFNGRLSDIRIYNQAFTASEAEYVFRTPLMQTGSILHEIVTADETNANVAFASVLPNDIGFTDVFTLSFILDSNTTDAFTIFEKSAYLDGRLNGGWRLRMAHSIVSGISSPQLRFETANKQAVWSSTIDTSPWVKGDINHLTIVYTKSTDSDITLYQNGIKISTITIKGEIAPIKIAEPLLMGCADQNTGIESVKLYHRALRDSEIIKNYIDSRANGKAKLRLEFVGDRVDAVDITDIYQIPVSGAQLIFALYKDGKPSNIKIVDIPHSIVDGSMRVSVEGGYTIHADEEYKVFLWSLEDMKPLSDPLNR